MPKVPKILPSIWLVFALIAVDIFAVRNFLSNQNLTSFVSTMEYQEQMQHQEPQLQEQEQHQMQPQPPAQHRRRLEFVHIPKTGGTAIASIAWDANITWSICHFGIPVNIFRISNNLTRCSNDARKHNWPYIPKPANAPWWHVPSHHFEVFFPDHNPYQGADLFCVVRNPYERIISEHYYIRNDVQKSSETLAKEKLNQIIQQALRRYVPAMHRGDAMRKIRGNDRYFMNSGHYIPQYDFVYDDRHRRVIDHVLHFENLTAEFDDLMLRYEIPLRLPAKMFRHSEKKLGVSDLTKATLELIEAVYSDDFREFGYEMLSLNAK